MQFTPDGYTEPLAPRVTHLGLGALLVLGGLALGWFLSACAATVVVALGLMVLANEGGQKRIRVTRRHLLLENEYRVWGLLVGPVRSRIRWEETKDVVVANGAVEVTKNDGSMTPLGVGGPEKELNLLRDRINQRRENFEADG